MSGCLRLLLPRGRRVCDTVLVEKVLQNNYTGTLLVAVDRATLPIPDEYKGSSASPSAILDFDKLQVRVGSSSATPEDPIWAGFPRHLTRFLVMRAMDLMIHLYLPAGEDGQDTFLGHARRQVDCEARNKDRQFTFSCRI